MMRKYQSELPKAAERFRKGYRTAIVALFSRLIKPVEFELSTTRVVIARHVKRPSRLPQSGVSPLGVVPLIPVGSGLLAPGFEGG